MIETREVTLRAILAVPEKARSIVLFAHGAGSSRHSPRNQHVAQKLQEAGLATLLLDLLTEDEERIDMYTGRLRFDIPFLAGRLDAATGWVLDHEQTSGFDIGYFGASTGAAAALVASVQRPEAVRAIVSRGGTARSGPERPAGGQASRAADRRRQGHGSHRDEPAGGQEADDGARPRHRSRAPPTSSRSPASWTLWRTWRGMWFAQHMRMPAEVQSAGGGRRNHIDAYSFGRIRVSGDDFDDDLIVFPDKVEPYWKRR